MAFAQVALKSFELMESNKTSEEAKMAEPLRIPFLKLGLELATELGYPYLRKQFDRVLAELRYAGVRVNNARPLLEVVRVKVYIPANLYFQERVIPSLSSVQSNV